MKVESLVIVGQHTTVNSCLGLVHTARHTWGVCLTRKGGPGPSPSPVLGPWSLTGRKEEPPSLKVGEATEVKS